MLIHVHVTCFSEAHSYRNTSRTERTVLNILSLRTPSPPSPTDIVSVHTHLNNRSSIIAKMYDAYKSPW